MAKRFKLRISRLIIPCFRPCCSKRPSTTRPSDGSDDDFLWKKEDKWHVVANVYDNDDGTTPSRRKIHNSSASGGSGLDGAFPLPPSKRRYKKKKRTPARGRSRTSCVSNSSADRSRGGSDGYDDEEEETEALVSSSRSDTPAQKEHTLRRRRRKKNSRKQKSGWWVAAKVSAFEGMMGWKVEGKVRESVAVVKKSEDPYKDFRRSMMEMIVEKKMFEHKDLEQLLSCFLSLNSTHYHPIIVQAFTDIWDTLFCFCIINTT